MEYHPAASIFPLMGETELQSLADDIRQHGLIDPIELFDGKIIDGRNRATACLLAGVKPRTVEVQPDNEGFYVVSKNLHRRHLTTGQRAMIADSLREYVAKAAKERQKRKPENSVLMNSPEQKGNARDKLGEIVGVGGAAVDVARRVKQQGSPQLVKAVESGTVTLNAARNVLELPHDKQLTAAQEQSYPERATNSISSREPEPTHKSRGVGVRYGNEAVDALKRIPPDDPLRKRGFQIVTDWIRANK